MICCSKTTLLVIMLLIGLNSTAVTRDGYCPSNGRLQHVSFSGKVKDHILEGFIDSSKEVSSDVDCQMLCILNGKCNMFNLGDMDSSLHGSCQVLRFGAGYTVKRKKGWSFRGRRCLSSPCLNGGTCFTLDESNTPRCACTEDWTGQTCAERACIPQALGMESGAIPNSQLRASSQRNHASGPSRGRLNVKESNTLVGAWVSSSDNLNQWLQIDLGNHNTNFTHVATQGRNAFSTQWVTKYKLELSNNGDNFQYYKEEGQVINKEFGGNTDRDTVVKHELNPPVRARYIRFRPTAWNVKISMRVEVYGCPEEGNQTKLRLRPNPSVCRNCDFQVVKITL